MGIQEDIESASAYVKKTGSQRLGERNEYKGGGSSAVHRVGRAIDIRGEWMRMHVKLFVTSSHCSARVVVEYGQPWAGFQAEIFRAGLRSGGFGRLNIVTTPRLVVARNTQCTCIGYRAPDRDKSRR